MSLTPRQIADTIVTNCAKEYGVSVDDIFSRVRVQKIAHARQACYARLHNKLGWSASQIGRYINRDHSTVFYGIKALQERARLTA